MVSWLRIVGNVAKCSEDIMWRVTRLALSIVYLHDDEYVSYDDGVLCHRDEEALEKEGGGVGYDVGATLSG